MNSILIINTSLSDKASGSQTFTVVDVAVSTQAESAAHALPEELISELKTADVVVIGDPLQLHGDGLAAAITARLFAKSPGAGRCPKGLAPWQLRRVIDYMEASLPQRIELARLAAMLGLSQAHFSRAFKASTGLAPYRWQLDFRIRHAQELLIDTSSSLDQVAEATGFADAVHFGRMFRKLIGVTPAVWRHERKS